jgi:hypothetical protein
MIKDLCMSASNGKKFENFFIETISCGGFNLFFPSIKAKFNKISNKKLGFISIPQDKSEIKKMKFLEGLKESLKYMDTKEIETAVLVPIFHQFSEDKKFLNG